MKWQLLLAVTAFFVWAGSTCVAAPDAQAKASSDEKPAGCKEGKCGNWICLFDGESLGDWKPSERPESWSVQDGSIVCQGSRSHLFYMGKDNDFENFHFRAEVKTAPNSNSGIYFHTRWQDGGWPRHGYESQVNVSHGDPVKSGSLYNTVKIYKDDIEKAGLKNDTWWTQEIIVQGKHVVVKLNGETVVDYTEPDDKEGTVKLSHGTFALQAHDPKSTVYFRKLEVRRLPAGETDAE